MTPDSDLLQRYHHSGDSLAFDELVRAHSVMVHATACRVTQNAALAEEVAQEVFWLSPIAAMSPSAACQPGCTG